MGIGPDGHTASLFPNAPALDETERRAVAAEAGMEPFVPRVTMTRPVLGAAETMVYLVTGEGEGRRGEARVRGRAVAGHAGEPRPRAADGRVSTRCGCAALSVSDPRARRYFGK